MHTMLIPPTKHELTEFGKPDFVIYNAGGFLVNSLAAGMGSKTSVNLSIEDKELVILGTEYAGEMKKAYSPWRITLHPNECRNRRIRASCQQLGQCWVVFI